MSKIKQRSSNKLNAKISNVSHKKTGMINYGNLTIQNAKNSSIVYKKPRVDDPYFNQISTVEGVRSIIFTTALVKLKQELRDTFQLQQAL